ncbi:MAG: cytochrome c peroxidase [Bacteroidota bacterium]
MRALFFFLFTSLLMIACSTQNSNEGNVSNESKVKNLYAELATNFHNATKALEKVVLEDMNDSTQIRLLFQETRNNYKQLEAIFEYYNPELGKKLNGPAIFKSDIHAPERVIPPSGFQVLEELIFPVYNLEELENIEIEAKRINARVSIISRDAPYLELNDQNVIEAVKAEFYRIGSLGLAAFDCPVTLNAIEEMKYSLKGIEQILNIYSDALTTNQKNELESLFEKAYQFIEQNPDFLSFPRLVFTTEYLQPLYSKVFQVQEANGIENNSFRSPVDYSNKLLFANNPFDVNFFSPNDNQLPNDKAVEFGRVLFYDANLSVDGTRSCATCHNPSKAFSDGLSKSISVNGSPVKRNSPTILNSGYQQNQFYDSRVQLLETQIKDVINNPSEMHGNFREAVKKISSDEKYLDLAKAAYDVEQIENEDVLKGLAAYVRSLDSFNSRFDQYLAGNKSQLNEAEVRGFNLYMGKAKCGTCHFTPLFNGTLPPHYLDTESEVIGVPSAPDTINATVDADSGRFYKHYGAYNLFAFKTPTVRNITLTAPYMHNGVYETLEEVMDFYNRGGGAGIGAELDHQTLPPDHLELTDHEIGDIISFLGSLTDTTSYKSKAEYGEAISLNTY